MYKPKLNIQHQRFAKSKYSLNLKPAVGRQNVAGKSRLAEIGLLGRSVDWFFKQMA